MPRAGSLAEIVASEGWVIQGPVEDTNYDCMCYDGMNHDCICLLRQARKGPEC